jgi:hypothetical protein
VFRTLCATKGYKQVRLPPFRCTTCARFKARNFGLRNIGPAPLVCLDAVFDDDTDSDNGSDCEDQYADASFEAAVAGRELGTQPVPRYDLQVLRPFEIMFVDNKDYTCLVRGGTATALVFIDYLTRLKFKVDLRSKKHNGKAFRAIVAMNGIRKLQYPCRVFSDGFGSMAHVKEAAVLMGIDHAYVPPHQQSLNEAEKICDTIWAAARALMLHSNAPDSMFALAVNYGALELFSPSSESCFVALVSHRFRHVKVKMTHYGLKRPTFDRFLRSK